MILFEIHQQMFKKKIKTKKKSTSKFQVEPEVSGDKSKWYMYAPPSKKKKIYP